MKEGVEGLGREAYRKGFRDGGQPNVKDYVASDVRMTISKWIRFDQGNHGCKKVRRSLM